MTTSDAHVTETPRLLGKDELKAWLASHASWSAESQKLVRTLTFPDFQAALTAANLLGEEAERANHHPDLVVGWQKLRVEWSTHDVGGISNLDIQLAARTDELLGPRAVQGGPDAGPLRDEERAARAALAARLSDILGNRGAPPVPSFDQALTHPSFANEYGGDDNQRLEFLGDAVLGVCVSEYLSEQHPEADEGALTRMRSALVNAEALAEWAREKAGGQARKVGILDGDPSYLATERAGGFEDGIKGTNWSLVARINGGWSVEKGNTAAMDLLQAHPDIQVLYASNDYMAEGAALAAKSLGRSDLTILGYDGDTAALESIANGEGVTATTNTNPVQMGRMTAQFAVDLLNKKATGGYVNAPTEIIHKDNAVSVLKNAGELFPKPSKAY